MTKINILLPLLISVVPFIGVTLAEGMKHGNFAISTSQISPALDFPIPTEAASPDLPDVQRHAQQKRGRPVESVADAHSRDIVRMRQELDKFRSTVDTIKEQGYYSVFVDLKKLVNVTLLAFDAVDKNPSRQAIVAAHMFLQYFVSVYPELAVEAQDKTELEFFFWFFNSIATHQNTKERFVDALGNSFFSDVPEGTFEKVRGDKLSLGGHAAERL